MANSQLPGLDQSYGKASSNVQLVAMPWTYGNGYMLDFIKLKMGSARLDNFGSDGTLGGHSGDGTPFL